MENQLTEIGGPQSELERLREKLFMVPHDTAAMRTLATLLEEAGDLPGAIDLHQRALRVDPYHIPVLVDLGRLWNQLGDTERARSWFTRALSIDADCAEASTGLADLVSPGELTSSYIRTLFDQYAEHFDEDLTVTLKYQAPVLIAMALDRCGIGESAVDILDLGCGTGLSGLAMLRFSRTLDGVDLSPMMVGRARARGIYGDLAVAEAEQFLTVTDKSWDVITAVDMLNYVGHLTPLIRVVASRLRPGGLLAGTVERSEGEGFILTAKRRYTHSGDHLKNALSAAGLSLLETCEADLRYEAGVPVVGLVFVARR